MHVISCLLMTVTASCQLTLVHAFLVTNHVTLGTLERRL